MASRTVVENECDRCTRTWYTKAEEKEVPAHLQLSFVVGEESVLANFKCLCAGCRKTVKTLAESISKVLQKSAPVRGAKKAAEKPEGPSTAPDVTAAPTAAAVGPASKPASANGSSSSGSAPSAAPAAHQRSSSTKP